MRNVSSEMASVQNIGLKIDDRKGNSFEFTAIYLLKQFVYRSHNYILRDRWPFKLFEN